MVKVLKPMTRKMSNGKYWYFYFDEKLISACGGMENMKALELDRSTAFYPTSESWTVSGRHYNKSFDATLDLWAW